ARRKVRVNAVAPGTTESEGTSELHLFEGDEGKKVISSTPLGRLGTPADIARVVVFLASDESAWVTGEVIRASGGLKEAAPFSAGEALGGVRQRRAVTTTAPEDALS